MDGGVETRKGMQRNGKMQTCSLGGSRCPAPSSIFCLVCVTIRKSFKLQQQPLRVPFPQIGIVFLTSESLKIVGPKHINRMRKAVCCEHAALETALGLERRSLPFFSLQMLRKIKNNNNEQLKKILSS